jgi:hypothetical protein
MCEWRNCRRSFYRYTDRHEGRRLAQREIDTFSPNVVRFMLGSIQNSFGVVRVGRYSRRLLACLHVFSQWMAKLVGFYAFLEDEDDTTPNFRFFYFL